MLLAIDIGNSIISVGVLDDEKKIVFLSSVDTDSRKTADQISIDLMNIFALYDVDIHAISGAIFSSVVPGMNFSMEKALTRLTGKPPMVAALEKYPAPIIMVEMGTATTISYISSQKIYEGGLMFPGVYLSMNALSGQAALLPNISLEHPRSLIGKNSADCLRNGVVYGTAAMLDGIIDRIREMIPGETPTVVATGSPAPVITRYCRNAVTYDKYLLMEGLWAIYHRNR